MQAYIIFSLVRSPALELIIQLFLFVALLLLPQKSMKKDHYIRGQMVLVGRKLLFHKAQRNLLVMSLVFCFQPDHPVIS